MEKHREIARKILGIEQELEERKAGRSELKGQLKSATHQLGEFKILDPEGIPAKIEELTNELEKLDRLMSEKTEETEALFEMEE